MDVDPLTAIVGAILGGGLLTGIAAFRKAGPERENMTVDTLRGVIQELREEITRLSAEVEVLRKENKSLRRALSDLRKQMNGH